MKYFLVVLVLVSIGISGFFIFRQTNLEPMDDKSTYIETDSKQDNFKFSNPKKSAHYESNTPEHGSILAGVPINVVIDFNFDLAKNSEIKIINNEIDYGVGETEIDDNLLAMRRAMKSDSPNGIYTVEYNACWPDTSCHKGSFQFAVSDLEAESYFDQTDSANVVIKMTNVRFTPQNIKIKAGTTITWINDDEVEHYVNTDSHPAHTFFPEQNSKLLKKGEEFALTFNKKGVFPYHCSAHAANMVGSLVVE